MTKAKAAPAGEPARTFEVEAARLRPALKDVAGVVEARSTIPILSNVLLTVTADALTITGTDMDVWGERRVALDGPAQTMALTIEASTLGRIADKLPTDARVRFALADGKVTLSAGRSKFTIPTLPTDSFPALPHRDWDAEFEIPALMLASAFHAVGFAQSSEETRYYLNGVFMHAPASGDLRFAATDGHRLARGALALPDGAQTAPDVIVPRKVVKLLSALLDRHEGLVDVRLSANSIRVEIGETVVQAKLIDGTYPDYTRVVPRTHDALLKVDREALLAAVGRVSTISSDKVRAIKIVFDRDVATLSVTSPETGTAAEELPCDWQGSALTIGFNSRYLMDILGHLSANEVEATFTDAAGPVLWRDREDAPAIFVLMPLRV